MIYFQTDLFYASSTIVFSLNDFAEVIKFSDKNWF